MQTNVRTRRGGFSLETLLLIPVLLGVVLAVVEFGMYLANQSLVESASAQAVRIAARGGSEKDITRTVERILGKHRFSRADVFVTSANADGSAVDTGDPIEIRIEILARDVVPDLLVFVGFGLGDRKLTGRAVFMKE